MIFSQSTRTRILEFLKTLGTPFPPDYTSARTLSMPWFEAVNYVLRRDYGADLTQLPPLVFGRKLIGHPCFDVEAVCSHPDPAVLENYLLVSWSLLSNGPPGYGPVSVEQFESRLNTILADAREERQLRGGAWVSSALTATEAIRRALLDGRDEVAGCKQGDIQVETVVSTIQQRLSTPGSIVLDYGAGLGRVLAGLTTASLFSSSTYIAVDDPIPQEVRELARTKQIDARFISRADFLSDESVSCDVLLLVNTLHHIPFAEVPSQLNRLLRSLRPGGHLLVHEMGELRTPEQRNVPWHIEDVLMLFSAPSLASNPRTIASRSGVPLSNTLITVREAGDFREVLSKNSRMVWSAMKTRVVEEIDRLYDQKDPTEHIALEMSLIVNANLDLNKPA